MSADDCIKVIVAIGAAQLAMVGALTKLYLAVKGNGRKIVALNNRVTLKG